MTKTPTYKELIEEYPLPSKIETEENNDYYLKVYKKVFDILENLVNNRPIENTILSQQGYNQFVSEVEINQYLEELSEKIEDFEKVAYPIPDSKPHEMLQFLMNQHDLSITDMCKILGFENPSIMTVILIYQTTEGKMPLTTDMITKLSEYFAVSEEVFMEEQNGYVD